MDLSNYQHTPIQKMKENLNSNSYFVKRDDLFPVSFGGNKARKAILFFEDLYSKKSDCIVTYGSSSSNHCRVIANIAASKDITCHIISPEESSITTSNSKLINLCNAIVTKCPLSEVNSTLNSKMLELRRNGYSPYFIQGGGHGNIGTEAYVRAYEEILEYENTYGVYFDYIFMTSGTGTTQAGLICGKLLNGDKRHIVGISIARKNPYGSQVILDSVNNYFTNHSNKITIDEPILFLDDYILDGYGSYNKEIIETIKSILNYDGIPMDTCYTGKGFWGMKEYIKKMNISDKQILFIHTGGTPLFFDKLEDL